MSVFRGEMFPKGQVGMAAHGTMCTQQSVGLSVDINVYEAHLLAGTMAHMIGHNIGMAHDDNRKCPTVPLRSPSSVSKPSLRASNACFLGFHQLH